MSRLIKSTTLWSSQFHLSRCSSAPSIAILTFTQTRPLSQNHTAFAPTRPCPAGISSSSLTFKHNKRLYSSQPSTEQIRLYTAKTLHLPAENKLLIDVREPKELVECGHIPSAVNMPLISNPDAFSLSPEAFQQRFGFPRPGTDTPGAERQEVVFYCRAGIRSRTAAMKALAEDGWDVSKTLRIGDVQGGWLAWERDGGAIER